MQLEDMHGQTLKLDVISTISPPPPPTMLILSGQNFGGGGGGEGQISASFPFWRWADGEGVYKNCSKAR